MQKWSKTSRSATSKWEPAEDFRPLTQPTYVVLPLREVHAELETFIGPHAREVLGRLIYTILEDGQGHDAFKDIMRKLGSLGLDSLAAQSLFRRAHSGVCELFQLHLPKWDHGVQHYDGRYYVEHSIRGVSHLVLAFYPYLYRQRPIHANTSNANQATE